jgi:hypothetical protein
MEAWLLKTPSEDNPPPESIPADAGEEIAKRARIGRCFEMIDMR